jgi:hypothetical protein
VNTCYKHFYYFVREFELIGLKELEPLQEMTAMICKDATAHAPHHSMASPSSVAQVPEVAR